MQSDSSGLYVPYETFPKLSATSHASWRHTTHNSDAGSTDRSTIESRIHIRHDRRQRCRDVQIILFKETSASSRTLYSGHSTQYSHLVYNVMWRNICGSLIFGRPFIKPFALCHRTAVLSVCLSVLSGCNILWPNDGKDQDEAWHGGRSRPRPLSVRWGARSIFCKITLTTCLIIPQFILLYLSITWTEWLLKVCRELHSLQNW